MLAESRLSDVDDIQKAPLMWFNTPRTDDGYSGANCEFVLIAIKLGH